MPINISNLIQLLNCPVCHQTLELPTTLQCAHSVCSSHLPNPPSCPLPTCPPPHSSSSSPSSSTSSSSSFSNSAVAYFLPPVPSFPHSPTPKVDVTVNKIISLLRRSHQQRSDQHEDDDSDPDNTRPSHSPPSSPQARPRKRRRHRHSSSSSSHSHLREFNDQPDLLQHLREQGRLQRQAPPDLPLPDFGTSNLPHSALETLEKNLLVELTCEICFSLLYQPVTTPCQHTFCSICLHRSLDHNTSCPLCRQDVPGFAYFQDHPCNKVVLSIILSAYPSLYAERGNTIETEERDTRLDTPIFIGQLCFPGMPTLLHFFEPRYRLMLRRCLQSRSPRFGMIMPPRTGPSPVYDGDYGTMLEIRSVQMLPDGRSMVETWGTHRFRVMERGSLDGYMVGRIEIIDDYPEDFDDAPLPTQSASTSVTPGLTQSSSSSSHSLPPSPPSSSSFSTLPPSPPITTTSSPASRTNAELMTTCKLFLSQLRQGVAPWVVQSLSNTYGPMPTDPSNFSFWVGFVLPIDEHEKAKLLPIRSARLRLQLVVHWMEQLNDNWWFAGGCVIL